MCVAVNSHALPIYKKNRIASLLCIFETTILAFEEMLQKSKNAIRWAYDIKTNTCSRSVGWKHLLCFEISVDGYAVCVSSDRVVNFQPKHTA